MKCYEPLLLARKVQQMISTTDVRGIGVDFGGEARSSVISIIEKRLSFQQLLTPFASKCFAPIFLTRAFFVNNISGYAEFFPVFFF